MGWIGNVWPVKVSFPKKRQIIHSEFFLKYFFVDEFVPVTGEVAIRISTIYIFWLFKQNTFKGNYLFFQQSELQTNSCHWITINLPVNKSILQKIWKCININTASRINNSCSYKHILPHLFDGFFFFLGSFLKISHDKSIQLLQTFHIDLLYLD